MENVYCPSIFKDLDKQYSENECLAGIKLPKIVCVSDNITEITSDSCSMPDKIVCNTPNVPQRKISDQGTAHSVSLMPGDISDCDSYNHSCESFEPWSIHRTPAKLRGMYIWSPFLKYK